MARRLRPERAFKPKFQKQFGNMVRSLFGKLFLLTIIGILVVIAIPIFTYGFRTGGNFMPNVTQFFSKLSAPSSPVTPTPQPSLVSELPQPGTVSYTVESGDSCVSILAFEMHMVSAGTIFSDAKPETVKALNKSLGQDCHKLQPGMVLPLSPHYPLVAVGGQVQKIEALAAQQVLPTPLIHLPPQEVDGEELPPAPDCSRGCKLTVRISPQTSIYLSVETGLDIREGAWVWAQAMLPRQTVRGFDNYPYVDPKLSYDGKLLRACDFQVDDIHDDHSKWCQELTPNTIVDDGGSWMLAVTGPGALDHWKYPLKVASGTQVLLWLSLEHGKLQYKPGNPAYRYNATAHIYQKL